MIGVEGRYSAAVSRPRAEQFKVRFPDGWLAERLPIGAAAGRWWLTVVFSGVNVQENPSADPLQEFQGLQWDLRDRIRLKGVGAPFDLVGGGGGGDGRSVVDASWEFSQNGVTGLEIEYLHEGRPVAHESIGLVP